MGLFRRSKASGGAIKPRGGRGEVIRLSKGLAVVPDEVFAKYGHAYLSALNDGAVVLSASEAAEMTDENDAD